MSTVKQSGLIDKLGFEGSEFYGKADYLDGRYR